MNSMEKGCVSRYLLSIEIVMSVWLQTWIVNAHLQTMLPMAILVNVKIVYVLFVLFVLFKIDC